jgi:hypothetical protein
MVKCITGNPQNMNKGNKENLSTSNVIKCPTAKNILVKNVSVLANSTGSSNTLSRWTDFKL